MSSVEPATVRQLQDDLGGAEIMRELIDTFLAEAPRLLETMQEGLERRRPSELNRAAHSLKSSAGTFGATQLSQLARELERASERGMPPDAEAQVKMVEAEWARVRAELERLRP